MKTTPTGTAIHAKTQLKRVGLFFMALGFFGILLLYTLPSSALPAAKYRYRSGECGRTDSECMKYSADAGTYRLYRGILNRNPDSGGMGFWAARLDNGSSSLTDAANSLIASSEWRNAYQHLNNQQFVNQTYQFALRRSPDTSGYNYWVGKLNSGTSKGQMASSIIGGSESAGAWHGTFMATYYPAPPPPPTPPPTPPPSSPQPSRPPVPSRTPSPTAPAASAPTPSGQQITDLVVSEQSYRSALITWNTPKPSVSKINFSTNKEDLYNEAVKDELNTTHSIRLEGDQMLAGRHYYFRVTANDGTGPVTVDGEFDTKAVSVIIKITDEQDKPIAEAEVTAGDQEHTTDENGEVQLEMPEGEQTIFARKDDLSRELAANIEVPDAEAEDPIQRISLALTKAAGPSRSAVQASPQKKGAPWLLIILAIIGIGGLVGGFLLWRRRNQQKSSEYFGGDPLEAENYTQQVIPTTPPDQLPVEPSLSADIPAPTAEAQPAAFEAPPEPQYMPVEDPHIPHHASLPELVGRYGAQEPEEGSSGPTMPTVPTADVSPTGQQVPHHSSLKDLVEMPASAEPHPETEPESNDLPVSPVQTEMPSTEGAQQDLSPQADDDSDHTTLTIPR